MAEADRPIEGYPPERHFLRDLGIAFERDGEDRCIRLPVVPEILTDLGALDAGMAAAIVDTAAGGAALEAVQPDWIVTSDMTLHLARPVKGGELTGRTRTLRAGRNNVVVETELFSEGSGLPAVIGQLGFTRVPRREGTPVLVGDPPAHSTFVLPSSGFTAHAYQQLDLRVLDASSGRLELGLAEYQRNSVGAMQGGLVVALATKSAESIVRAALGAPLVATDLAAHYLALGKVGPLRSEATLIRRDPDAAVVRVALCDAGQGDRLCTLVTVTVRDFG